MTIHDLFKDDTIPRTPTPAFVSTNEDQISSLLQEALPKIQVLGIGGAGNNAIDRLIEVGITGAQTVAMNTDAQHLLNVTANKKLLLGTSGRGAGNDPRIGEAAAKESAADVQRVVDGDMVFIVCGLGGGTGTGAAPTVAKIAKEQKALTVGICTLPFRMEGTTRRDNAAKGLDAFYKNCDALFCCFINQIPELSSCYGINTSRRFIQECNLRIVKNGY